MGKFRRHNWDVMLYNSCDDEKRLYEKSLDIIGDYMDWVSERLTYYLKIQDIFHDPISIQQIKQDLKFLLKKDKCNNSTN